MPKKTVIIGATPNPARYAFQATELLAENGHEIVPVGIRKGTISGKEILDVRSLPVIPGVDTVTLYVSPRRQEELKTLVLKLKPTRVIFNPGTENIEFEKELEEAGISAIEACTLVMLRTGQY